MQVQKEADPKFRRVDAARQRDKVGRGRASGTLSVSQSYDCTPSACHSLLYHPRDFWPYASAIAPSELDPLLVGQPTLCQRAPEH